MVKSQEIKGNFTLGAPILKIDVGISVFGWLYLNMEWAFIYFFPHSLYASIYYVQFLNGLSYSVITFQIWISKDINFLYKDRVYSRNEKQNLLK